MAMTMKTEMKELYVFVAYIARHVTIIEDGEEEDEEDKVKTMS